MPEVIGDWLPVPKERESSPLSRITNRVNAWIFRHTPKGRELEYLNTWSHVLEGIQGSARYELEKKLAADAAKYARDRVVRDVLVGVAATGGLMAGAFGVNELRKKQWNMSTLFTDLGAGITHRAKDLVINASKTATTLAMTGAGQAIADSPHLIGNIVETATEQGTAALRQAAASQVIQKNLSEVGTHAAGAVVDGAIKEIAERTSSLPHQINATFFDWLAGLLPRAKTK